MSDLPTLVVYVIYYTSPYNEGSAGILISEGFYTSRDEAAARVDKIRNTASSAIRGAYSICELTHALHERNDDHA